MSTYVFDIDGTICTQTFGSYDEAIPYLGRIRKINNLYDQGNNIIYYTARGMGSSGNDVSAAYDKWYRFTEKQIGIWGAKYHKLFLGKPAGDLYVDDKGMSDDEYF